MYLNMSGCNRETFSDVIKEVILEQKLVREREQRKLMLETKKQSYVNNVRHQFFYHHLIFIFSSLQV